MVIGFGFVKNVSMCLPTKKSDRMNCPDYIHANATLNGKVKDVRAI